MSILVNRKLKKLNSFNFSKSKFDQYWSEDEIYSRETDLLNTLRNTFWLSIDPITEKYIYPDDVHSQGILTRHHDSKLIKFGIDNNCDMHDLYDVSNHYTRFRGIKAKGNMDTLYKWAKVKRGHYTSSNKGILKASYSFRDHNDPIKFYEKIEGFKVSEILKCIYAMPNSLLGFTGLKFTFNEDAFTRIAFKEISHNMGGEILRDYPPVQPKNIL